MNPKPATWLGRSLTMEKPSLHAVIGVWFRDGRTFYVHRSRQMQNYPGAWSLLSIQYEPDDEEDVWDFSWVQSLMERMADDRLGGVGIRVKRYLSTAVCSDNPMRQRVKLHMYQIELDEEPRLNPAFYDDRAWMTPEEYVDCAAGGTCGLCMRMWSDYSVRKGLSSAPFAPPVVAAS